MPRNKGQSFPEKILCILCIDVHQKSKNMGAFCNIPQARVLGTGGRDSEFEEKVGSVTDWPQEAQKRDRSRLEPLFVPFVLFVVEPVPPFAGQGEPLISEEAAGHPISRSRCERSSRSDSAAGTPRLVLGR